VLLSLYTIVYAGSSGASTATQMLVARFLGMGASMTARRVAFIGAGLVVAIVTFFLVGILVSPAHVLSIWTDDAAVVALCASVSLEFGIYLVVNGVRYHVEECLYAMHKGTLVFVANNVGCWGAFLPLAYLGTMHWGWGLHGYWRADLAGEVVKLVILVIFGWLRLNWDAETKVAAQSLADSTDSETSSTLDSPTWDSSDTMYDRVKTPKADEPVSIVVV
ncbi:hypothetical protein As57867_007381, partial [Aphanomyces stellatus]